jgi:hypothetical protein
MWAGGASSLARSPRRRGTLPGFKGSSQHPEQRGCGWDDHQVGLLRRQEGRRCGRLAGRRWRGVSIGNGSGGRSRSDCPARTPLWCVGCPRRWGPGGSVKVAACHRSVWSRCRAATCRSPSARRSPSSGPRAAGFARSLGGSAGRRRRSRASCAATSRPVAACWSTGPRPRSGTLIGVPGARRWPSSPATTRCGSTCRTGLPD